jgi:hypothetical protein
MSIYRSWLFLYLLLAASFPLVAQQGPSSLTVIQPCRLFDSRVLPGGQPLQPGTTYQIQARGSCAIPEEANAIFFTVAATGAASVGNVKVWASDLTEPLAPTMSFRGYGTDTSASFSRLCAPPLVECSAVDLSIRPSFAAAHVILDVVGFTEPLPE